jgi:hypothetical protein
MVGISVPLLAGWVVSAALSKADVFMGPFFWVFTYVLVVGTGLLIWGAVTATRSRLGGRVRPGAAWTVVLEEVAFAIASFLLFSAFVVR